MKDQGHSALVRRLHFASEGRAAHGAPSGEIHFARLRGRRSRWPNAQRPTPNALHFRAGHTLIEMLVALLILTFVIGGGLTLYIVGYQQQRVALNYSTVQTDLRTGLARADR